ncbi:MAG: DUF4453 domain-containing protein [Pseudomonadota bacterium]
MRILISAFLALLAAPALADNGCHDLWYTRNAIVDRAGYCFGSALGQAVFDNAGCIGKSVDLSPSAKRQVDQIRAIEAEAGCKVNTAQTRLHIDDLAIRRRLIDLPIRDEFASGCLGYGGAPIALRAGHSAGAPAIGQIEAGDYVLFAFYGVGDWVYVTAHSDGWGRLKAGGWMDWSAIPQDACRDWAG